MPSCHPEDCREPPAQELSKNLYSIRGAADPILEHLPKEDPGSLIACCNRLLIKFEGCRRVAWAASSSLQHVSCQPHRGSVPDRLPSGTTPGGIIILQVPLGHSPASRPDCAWLNDGLPTRHVHRTNVHATRPSGPPLPSSSLSTDCWRGGVPLLGRPARRTFWQQRGHRRPELRRSRDRTIHRRNPLRRLLVPDKGLVGILHCPT